MEFVHTNHDPNDTIAAIATPFGEGGVAIIRLSGKEAIAIASKIFSGPVASYQTHSAHYGTVKDLSGKPIDQALLLPMLGKRSYTGEDTIEIHCHGGILITRRVLDAVFQAGARPAQPGEFTFRAYMNGKMDLAQAEAVQELICAKNEFALDAADSQLKGQLSQKIGTFQKELTQVAAILEAWVDFPEEDLEFATMEELCEQLKDLQQEMQKLIDTFHDGRMIKEGISICLIGAPNVGKSSLMNALLDKERAIVSAIPGTTRDIVEDHFRLNGLNIRLLDTAGIRDNAEIIEQEGIRRSKEAMSQADLILLVLDASRSIEEQEKQLLATIPNAKTIVVRNKIDLKDVIPLEWQHESVVNVSAKEKIGIDELKKMIDRIVWKHGQPSKDELLITNHRHKEALKQSIHFSERVVEGLKQDVSPEFLTMDMRQALKELGTIVGTNVSEDIISSIFSQFCIGK